MVNLLLSGRELRDLNQGRATRSERLNFGEAESDFATSTQEPTPGNATNEW